MEGFEAIVREVSFWAVLVLGALVLVGSAAAVAVWALKALLRALGLYRQFLAFIRTRRGGR